MTSIDDLKHDLKGVSDTVLTDLDAGERVRAYMKADVEEREDRMEMLRESAPRYEYKLRDQEFAEGTKMVYLLSIRANHVLERLHTAMMMYEAGRDKYVALVLLNEALERLSQGHFTVDEHGNADAPASWPHPHRWMDDADTSRLAEKYRELWDETDVPPPSRFELEAFPYFADLATNGLNGYRHEIAVTDEKLRKAVVAFYVAFHTFRRFAEEYLDITFDELLQVTRPEIGPFDTLPAPEALDEETCRDLLERKEFYLTAHEEAMKVLADFHKHPDTDDAQVTALFETDLDAEVDEAVEKVAAQLDYAI